MAYINFYIFCLMKRAVATITCYVYGETIEDLIHEGKEIQHHINDSWTNTSAEMEELHEIGFGKINENLKIKFER